MLTIFSIPKAFHGHIGMIQRNAIRSWAQLDGVEIILIGDDEGVAEIADEVDARHISQVEKTPLGTPLISAAFELARKSSTQPLLAYANADIILLPDVVRAVRKVRFDDFLLVGRRWEADLGPIDQSDVRWQEKLRAAVTSTAHLQEHYYIDYFVFRRESAIGADLPPFAVGRPRWDNWMILRARTMGLPVIDATPSVMAVHQRHDYAHVPGGTATDRYGPEAARNLQLFGDDRTPFGVWHATHVLTRRGPVRARGFKYLRNRWRTRHQVDGGFERFGRSLDPIVLPVLRVNSFVCRLRRAVSRAFGSS